MELEGRRGRGTREQRQEARGGGRLGSRKTAFYFRDFFVCYNTQIKMVLSSGPVSFQYVRLLVCGLQLSIYLSDTDILKLKPMAANETWKSHLTKLKALVCVLGQKEASRLEYTLFSLPGLTKYSFQYKYQAGTLCKQHICTQYTNSLPLGFPSKRGQSHELVGSLLSEPIILQEPEAL